MLQLSPKVKIKILLVSDSDSHAPTISTSGGARHADVDQYQNGSGSLCPKGLLGLDREGQSKAKVSSRVGLYILGSPDNPKPVLSPSFVWFLAK